MASRSEESLVSLRYPNGRVHEQSLATATRLKPGDEFDLYGHRWKAVELIRLRRGASVWPPMLCVLVDERVNA